MGCGQLPERLHGFFRLDLLNETDDGVDNEDGGDGKRIHGVASKGRNSGGGH